MLTYGMGEHLTGIGIYTRELCHALARINKGAEIVLINPYTVDSQEFFGDFENYYVPALRTLPNVLSLGPVLIPRVSRRLRLDICHDPCGISPYLLAGGPSTARRIVTIHDAVPYVHPEVQPFLTRLTFRTFVRASRWSTDAILTVSECSRQDLIRYVGFSEDKIHLTYPGVNSPTEGDILSLRKDGVRVLRKWNLSEPYFLYVGALNPRKNVPGLIAAFEKVLQTQNSARLVLVGPKTWWADESLRAARRFEHSVIVTGYISDHELRCLYVNAAALVYPSIYEGFGLPPLEAMAYGTPVITTNMSSLPEVVGDAGIMVAPTDIASLSLAMLEVQKGNIRMQLFRRGRERAEQFQWDSTARSTLDVYERVLSQSRELK